MSGRSLLHTFILDVGKTNLKSCVVNDRGEIVWKTQVRNPPAIRGDFLAIDVDAIHQFLLTSLQSAAGRFPVGAINISTHGACAVLLDPNGDLLFPVMDYEFDDFGAHSVEYNSARPDFSLTYSPKLGGGLNLGRQLWWLRAMFPERYANLDCLLMLPQFLVWTLTEVAVSEVTSLGCHTDLWEPTSHRLSGMALLLDVDRKMPECVPLTEPVAVVRPDLAARLGLPNSCWVYSGVHDSNAGLARYLNCGLDTPFSVISSGTWMITMAVGGEVNQLQESKDMLCNVSVLGQPVPCARFMGGREFEDICACRKVPTKGEVTVGQVQVIVDTDVFALPPFRAGSGPFGSRKQNPKIIGHPQHPRALATLYLALMLDYELTLLGSEGPILVGSLYQRNPVLCRLLAALRPQQMVLASPQEASTVMGAWQLTHWSHAKTFGELRLEAVPAETVGSLETYRDRWHCLAATTEAGESPEANRV